MSARLEKLEELLARVQKNADARPHLGGGVEASGGQLMELDAPGSVDGPRAQPSESWEDVDEITDLDDEMILDSQEEAPPESGSGPRHASSPMERAFSEAGDHPPMTPPPESGEEPAARVQLPPREGPTMEQLGETISLEEGPAEDLEVDEPTLDEEPSPASHLEAELPASVGAFDEKLAAPPEAQKELERVRLGETADLKAPTTVRPVISTNVIDLVQAHYDVEPDSFAQLLDRSLSL